MARTLARSYDWWFAKRSRARVALAFWMLVPVSFLGIGAWSLAQSLYLLPRTYDALERRGAPALATFHGCSRRRGGDCVLGITFAGKSRTWDYGPNHKQFDRLARGAPVPVLVDPEHPSTVCTVADVERRTNAGFGLVAGFGVIIGAAGLAGFPWFLAYSRRELAEMRETEEAPQPPADAPDPALRELVGAILDLEDAIHDASPVWFSRDVRLPHELLAVAVAGVRETLLRAVPGSPAMRVVDRLEATVEAAPRLPFGLGVRIDKAQMLDLIDELHAGVGRELAAR